MCDPERKELIIECADGQRRAVTFQPGTNLVSRSVVVEPVHTSDLTDSQRKGLGLPEGYDGPLTERPGGFLGRDAPFGDPI